MPDNSAQDAYALPIFPLFKTSLISIHPCGNHHTPAPVSVRASHRSSPYVSVRCPLPPQMQHACDGAALDHTLTLWDALPTVRGIIISSYSGSLTHLLRSRKSSWIPHSFCPFIFSQPQASKFLLHIVLYLPMRSIFLLFPTCVS